MDYIPFLHIEHLSKGPGILCIPSTMYQVIINLQEYLFPGLDQCKSQIERYLEVYPRSSDLWYRLYTLITRQRLDVALE